MANGERLVAVSKTEMETRVGDARELPRHHAKRITRLVRTQQVGHEQPAASHLPTHVLSVPIGDGRHEAMAIHANPRTSTLPVPRRDDAGRCIEKAGRIECSVVRLVPVVE